MSLRRRVSGAPRAALVLAFMSRAASTSAADAPAMLAIEAGGDAHVYVRGPAPSEQVAALCTGPRLCQLRLAPGEYRVDGGWRHHTLAAADRPLRLLPGEDLNVRVEVREHRAAVVGMVTALLLTAGSVASLVAVEADQGFREGFRLTPTAAGALVGLGVALVAGGISAAFLGPVVETRAWSIPVKEEAP